jgi:hypothetical protein
VVRKTWAASKVEYQVVLADLWPDSSDHCRNKENHAAARNHWDSKTGDWRRVQLRLRGSLWCTVVCTVVTVTLILGIVPTFFHSCTCTRISGTTTHVSGLSPPALESSQADDSLLPWSLGPYSCTRHSTTVVLSSGAMESVGVLTLQVCS